jgi:catalase
MTLNPNAAQPAVRSVPLAPHSPLAPLALAGVVAALLALPAAAQTSTAPASTNPVAVVDSMEAVFGVTPAKRRNHTKGVCATGTFSANAEGPKLSRSPLLAAGNNVPVVARFSLAGGRPGIADAARNPRGLGLQFQLPGGVLHQMAMLNVPVFAADNPVSFHARLDADRPDSATGKPDPAKQKAVAEQYSDNKALGGWLREHRPPSSYANAAFHSLHAFKFSNAKNESKWVKWRFEPRDGVLELSDDAMKAAAPNFLDAALAERLTRGPAQWDLVLTLGEASDPLDNPTQAWPAERAEVKVGVLSLNASGGSACEAINYDPLVLSDGIEASANDPVLAFRSGAYAVSWVRRSGEAAAKP